MSEKYRPQSPLLTFWPVTNITVSQPKKNKGIRYFQTILRFSTPLRTASDSDYELTKTAPRQLLHVSCSMSAAPRQLLHVSCSMSAAPCQLLHVSCSCSALVPTSDCRGRCKGLTSVAGGGNTVKVLKG